MQHKNTVLHNDFVKFWALQQGKGIFSNKILTFGSTLKMKGEVAQLESDKNIFICTATAAVLITNTSTMYYINCIYIMYIIVVFCINDGCSAAKYRRVFGPLGGRNTYPDRHCLILASHTYSTIWTNTFDNLDKYFSQF